MQLTYKGRHRYELPSYAPTQDAEGNPLEVIRYVMDKHNPTIEYPYWDKIKAKKPVKKFIEMGLLVAGEDKPEPKGKEEATLGFKAFSEKSEKDARKWVARCNDLKTLRSFVEKETREAVKEALSDRIEALTE